MDVAQFDFALPEELIALRPVDPRDSARLLIVPAAGDFGHAQIRDMPEFLRPGDALVVNDSKVIAARLHGLRRPREDKGGAGAAIEVLLHKRRSPSRFSAFARPAKRLAAGDRLSLGQTLEADVAARGEGGEVELAFTLAGAALDAAIAREGEMPLPPYIAGKRRADARDIRDYQTLFARREGSVAAPTAGLHFSEALLDRLALSGVTTERVTLHVGAGTFLPVSAADTDSHVMHPEWAELDPAAANRLNAVRQAGGRIMAVGTTSLRTLETAARPDGNLAGFAGETRLFITPGYQFKSADMLLTNFHLPRSTLFMLVCAFSGMKRMKRAYAEAIANRYRFYSYGDACLLVGERA